MHFEPSAERGAALDIRMRARLADTLDYVFDEAGDELRVSPAEARRAGAEIRAASQSPNRFGAYYDMVLALEDNDIERARGMAREVLIPAGAREMRVAAIGDRAGGEAARYRRMLMNDPAMLHDCDAALLASAEARIVAAFDLLDRGFPAMANEIRALLREVVIAEGPEDPKAPTFDGASSYMLWGATLLNARGQTNVLDTAQALAHESGHNLLFGFCVSGSLVENSDEELFSSPLRQDARPMDGVFHATYVVARMHQTVSRLLEAGVIDDESMPGALADLAAHRRNFAAGDQVIRDGGRLTPLGTEVIESARSYMAGCGEPRGIRAGQLAIGQARR
ncbi:MAG: HEXXH motif-containing putative peptide modification protein [Sphingomicrobium sp.]